MVLSCLTIYAIAFSCVTLLIGKSYAATPVSMDIAGRHNDRRGTKLLHNYVRSSESMDMPDKSNISGKTSVLQSSYLPSNAVKVKKLSDASIRQFNESHSYFALFDPAKNVTQKLEALPKLLLNSNRSVTRSSVRAKGRTNEKDSKWGVGEKIKNFVAWDILQDSEMEVRVHYNGITAKETVVKTGVDEETGKRQGLKLRQLTDGTRFIQLIYTFDNKIQDCEYIRQKNAINKFLSSFKDDVEKAKTAYEIEKSEEDSETLENQLEEDDDDYMEEDEGKIERYFDDGSEDYEEGNEDFGSEYRNVTFQIIRRYEDLPKELAEWMNYSMLKRKCRENHRIMKQLAYDKKHGDESAKRLAEAHIERVKRGLNEVFIFPGTKWCGKSNTADKYTALGGFSKTDKCCRTHDHCHPLITAFEEKYGLYNFRPFTISHCRCDLRRKRDIMDVLLVPGTKWCGKGRRATKYTSLGGFSRTDKCCRVHDTMCPHWIGSLEEKYGLFNWRINTIMHCRCDKRFRACLKMAKTGTANFVGKLFFNVVQTKCFVLKPQEVCLKYSWWGTCEKKEYRKKAYLKDNLLY